MLKAVANGHEINFNDKQVQQQAQSNLQAVTG